MVKVRVRVRVRTRVRTRRKMKTRLSPVAHKIAEALHVTSPGLGRNSEGEAAVACQYPVMSGGGMPWTPAKSDANVVSRWFGTPQPP